MRLVERIERLVQDWIQKLHQYKVELMDVCMRVNLFRVLLSDIVCLEVRPSWLRCCSTCLNCWRTRKESSICSQRSRFDGNAAFFGLGRVMRGTEDAHKTDSAENEPTAVVTVPVWPKLDSTIKSTAPWKNVLIAKFIKILKSFLYVQWVGFFSVLTLMMVMTVVMVVDESVLWALL